MKTLTYAASLVIIILASSGVASGQSDLDKLDEKFSRHIQKVLPGWQHERVDPINKTENVLIQFWYSSGKSVKISVNPYHSAADAKAALEEFAKYARQKEILADVGDQAYTWGFANSKIVFRKGKLVVIVSARADVGAAPDERMLTQEERLEREKNQMVRWTREFAKHAAKAIDDK